MRIALAMVLVAPTFCRGQSTHVPPGPVGVWRQQNIEWVNAPKDLGYKERAGNSGILRFSPDGSFTLIYTTIYQRDLYENPSQGDAWTIYFGKWKRNGNLIDVSYAMVYRDIRKLDQNGKEICSPSLETKRLQLSRSRIVFDGNVYIRSPRLEAGVNKMFSNPPALPEFRCPESVTSAP